MAVKVLIRRIVPKIKAKEMIPLFRQMRVLAMSQKGYISGETLFSLEHPEECLVISRWTTFEHWQEWNRTSRRIELDNGMDDLLGAETEYKFYGVGLW